MSTSCTKPGEEGGGEEEEAKKEEGRMRGGGSKKEDKVRKRESQKDGEVEKFIKDYVPCAPLKGLGKRLA